MGVGDEFAAHCRSAPGLRLIDKDFRVVAELRRSPTPGTRTCAADGVAPRLHRSALVIKSRMPGQLAGSLCPNPVLRDGLRFDQVVGNRFAVVTSSALGAAEEKALSSRGAVVVSVGPGSVLGRWLRQGHARAAIVRPDGAVMQSSKNVQAICAAVPSFSVGQDAQAESDIRSPGAQTTGSRNCRTLST